MEIEIEMESKILQLALNLGYEIGKKDFSEGIHIDNIEVQKYLTSELKALIKKEGLVYSCL